MQVTASGETLVAICAEQEIVVMHVERDLASGVVTVIEAYRDTFAAGPILSLALALDGYRYVR